MRIDHNGYLDDDYIASQYSLSKPLIDITAEGERKALQEILETTDRKFFRPTQDEIRRNQAGKSPWDKRSKLAQPSKMQSKSEYHD